MDTLAEVRAEMAKYRPRVTVESLARELGISYARCSTLLNGDPFVELTPEGARLIAAAIKSARRAAEVAA